MTSVCLLLMIAGAGDQPAVKLNVASKAFTESVILGEIVRELGEHEGYEVKHRQQLGGTGLVWKALLAGDIDVYPDYIGTITQMILKDETLRDEQAIRAALAKHRVGMTATLGFDNSYAIGMKEEVAERLAIRRISDLRSHPEFKFGFSNEFVDRAEGWPGLSRRYQLPQTKVRGLDHSLAYLALDGGDLDATDLNTTDAQIKMYGLRVLEDDLKHFPNYSAVLLYRLDLEQRAPSFVAALKRLEGHITQDTMLALNEQVELEDVSEDRAAAGFLARELSVGEVIPEPSQSERTAALIERLTRHTLEHLLLVVVSLSAAIFVSVPLGVIAAKRPTLGHGILSAAEIIQTVPGLALLILLMSPVRWLGLSVVGPAPAIAALFLYSLLPIIRNTYTGIHDIPHSMRESATALGLTRWAQLRQIELPLASRLILAGIKTTAVINVGYATLGGLIGAGGYGELIMQGLRKSSEAKMLEGAIPAAVLALIVKWLFEFSERLLIYKGLRLKSAG